MRVIATKFSIYKRPRSSKLKSLISDIFINPTIAVYERKIFEDILNGGTMGKCWVKGKIGGAKDYLSQQMVNFSRPQLPVCSCHPLLCRISLFVRLAQYRDEHHTKTFQVNFVVSRLTVE